MAVALKKQRKLTNKEKESGIQPIIAEEKKEPIWIGEYRCFFSGNMKPVTKSFLHRLGQDLLEWTTKNPMAIRICEFFEEKGIGHSTYDNWRKQPEFGDAYEVAKRRIGRRRERGGIFKDGDLDAGFVKATMRQFMDEFKQDEIEQAALKKDDDKSNSGTQYVVIEKIPESSVVKKKEERNE